MEEIYYILVSSMFFFVDTLLLHLGSLVKFSVKQKQTCES